LHKDIRDYRVVKEIRRMNEIQDIHVVQPRGMEKTLFPHQLLAIQKMEEREKEKTVSYTHYAIESCVGIYADITGFGKTLSILGLMTRDSMEWNLEQDHIHSSILCVYGHGSILKKSLLFFKRIPTNLVVASTIILRQWEEELNHTTLRHSLFTSKRKVTNLDPLEYDVVLVAPQCFNTLMERFPNYAWKRFIFDEPSTTKIPGMRPIIAGYIWLLTATPDMLLYTTRNSSNFMSSIFSTYMDYTLYKNLIVKNEDSFVKQSYSLPPLYHKYHTCYQPVYNAVQNMISDNILAMISAGNVEGAVKSLGGNSTSNIYDLVRFEKVEGLEECERKLLRFERLGDEERVKRWKSRKDNLLRELEEFNHRIALLLSENTCHICFEKNVQPILVTCCQNMFCGSCILQWLQNHNSCPLCRKSITTENIFYIQSPSSSPSSSCRTDKEEAENDTETRKMEKEKRCRKFQTKMNVIVDLILDRGKEGKFIIFSSYDESFEPLCYLLHDHGIHYTQLQGRNESRSKQIIDFKRGEMTVLFLTSIHDSAGMNLQESTDVILYHPTSEDLETQIIGRAYRVGRNTPLHVHHLV